MEESFEIKFSRNQFSNYIRGLPVTSNFHNKKLASLTSRNTLRIQLSTQYTGSSKHYRVTRLTFTYRTSHSNNDHQFLFLYDRASSTDGLDIKVKLQPAIIESVPFPVCVAIIRVGERKKERKKIK